MFLRLDVITKQQHFVQMASKSVPFERERMGSIPFGGKDNIVIKLTITIIMIVIVVIIIWFGTGLEEQRDNNNSNCNNDSNNTGSRMAPIPSVGSCKGVIIIMI